MQPTGCTFPSCFIKEALLLFSEVQEKPSVMCVAGARNGMGEGKSGAREENRAHGGRNSQMKGAGMLVVSLRGVNFGFWSHLSSGQNAIIFSREGLV